MGQFGVQTRHWLESAIKQRKLLLRMNKSHKSQLQVEIAVDLLSNQLKAYSYENDVYMARFIRQNISDIEIIIPGSGATCHDKKMRELAEINRHAIMLLDEAAAVKHNTLKAENSKPVQYEMVLS